VVHAGKERVTAPPIVCNTAIENDVQRGAVNVVKVFVIVVRAGRENVVNTDNVADKRPFMAFKTGIENEVHAFNVNIRDAEDANAGNENVVNTGADIVIPF
jgi:hypothetical protein